MAKNVLFNKVFALGGRRISIDANRVTADFDRSQVEDAGFEGRRDTVLKGPHMSDLSFAGGTSYELEIAALPKLESDGEEVPVLLFMGNGSLGSFAATMTALVQNFKWTGTFGELAMFEMDLAPQVRRRIGSVLFSSVGSGAVGGATLGGGVQAGALPAGSELFVSYHVVDPPGVGGSGTRTLAAKLQSNPNNTDWSGAVDRLTIDTATTGAPGAGEFLAPGAVVHRLDGDVAAVTDTWWRLNFTGVTGTGPTFFVLAAIAIRTK